jgi:hypothetical protein
MMILVAFSEGIMFRVCLVVSEVEKHKCFWEDGRYRRGFSRIWQSDDELSLFLHQDTPLVLVNSVRYLFFPYNIPGQTGHF